MREVLIRWEMRLGALLRLTIDELHAIGIESRAIAYGNLTRAKIAAYALIHG